MGLLGYYLFFSSLSILSSEGSHQPKYGKQYNWQLSLTMVVTTLVFSPLFSLHKQEFYHGFLYDNSLLLSEFGKGWGFLAKMSSSRSDIVTLSVRNLIFLLYGALKPYTPLSNKTNKTKECSNPSQLPDPTKGLL
jgi:hypothetical protein